MPLTGYLIASKFRVIVHCLSHEQSMTCFPLSKGPEECQPHRTITLVNVNGNHYMSVFLKENYPMPPTTPYWNAHRNSSASAWKAMYWSHFELYNQLTSQAMQAHDQTFAESYNTEPNFGYLILLSESVSEISDIRISDIRNFGYGFGYQ
ncbi:hypothetical protein LXL04_010068 [Taraxacum kok-saghyz]